MSYDPTKCRDGIVQQSFGANSPNIVGHNNHVVINPDGGLSATEKALLASRISAHSSPNDTSEMIWCMMGDSQSTRLAMDLVEALRTAGWSLPGNGFCQGMGGKAFTGIVIEGRSPNDVAVPILDDLIGTFLSFGIAAKGWINPKLPPGQFKIHIAFSPRMNGV